MKKNNSYKKERLESSIIEILNDTLKNEIYNEEIKKASFVAVKLSNDFGVAKIYVDTLDRKEIDSVVANCQQASGIFRTALAKNLTIRRAPELVFVNDKSVDNVMKIDELLSKINM